jgi:polyferredoxin
MGIDIRDGQQLECITCALCIDACDNVMDKLGREQGLISYTTLSDYNHNMALATDAAGSIAPAGIRKPGGGFIDAIRRTDWRSVARPRVLVYFALWAAVGLGMLVAISMRAELGISVLHDRNPLYTVLSDGSIQNGYEVKILNMTNAPRAVTFAIDGLPGATLTSPNLAAEPVTALTLAVEPDLVFPLRIYVRVPRDALAEKTDFTMSVTAGDGEPAMADTVVRFEVPEGGR